MSQKIIVNKSKTLRKIRRTPKRRVCRRLTRSEKNLLRRINVKREQLRKLL